MAAGDVTVIGPYPATDKTAIDTAVTAGLAAANDTVVAWPCGKNQVMFLMIEQA